MSDVDDELLALAGGGGSSDEEEEEVASVIISREDSRTPPPPAKVEAPVKGVAKRKVPAKKPKRRGGSDESEEEGEASSAPSSPNSLQSAPMEESDSESDAPPNKSREDDENKYPVDGLFMSLAEKEEIMSLREVEREQILAERAQEKDRIHQNKLLRQLVNNEEQRNKKRSASTAELEDGQRKTSRARTKLGGTKVGETSSGIDTLKSRRAEKSERNRRREEGLERRKDRSPSYRDEFGADGDGESDVEWAGPAKRKDRTPEAKDSAPADLHDIERIRLSRSRFGQVCFYPGFDETITGCFVRIHIGPDPDTNSPVYRMAVIRGFASGRPYAMQGTQGQQIVTDQYVLAAHGKAQKEWPFIACSDSPFTEAEWARYQRVCQVEGINLPKKPSLLNKADDITKLLDRRWTEEELAAKLLRQNKLKNKVNGVDRKRLESSLQEAKNFGNAAKIAQLQDELDRLEAPRLAFRTSLTPAKKTSSSSNTPSQQERLAQVNAENRRRNEEAVRKAQLKERRKAKEIEEKLQRGELVEDDHSRRLKTRAKFVHDENDKRGSRNPSGASTPANGTPKLGAAKPSALLPHLQKLQQEKAKEKNGIPTIHKPIMDDEIIGALDLDIDENILD